MRHRRYLGIHQNKFKNPESGFITLPSGDAVFRSHRVSYSQDFGVSDSQHLRISNADLCVLRVSVVKNRTEIVKHICFVSLKSYDLLSENPEPKFIGGAERQQVLIGRGLRQLGYQVSFVTLDYGQPDGIEHNGIRVFKAYTADRGMPVLRPIIRWKGLCDAMRRANADVYHQMCADAETGQVALWCRKNRRRFIFSVASDADCDPDLPLLPTRRQRWLYKYGLRRADRVVTQTLSEQALLRSMFGINSTIIPSCTEDFESTPTPGPSFPKSGQVTLLWVSRIVPLKRLEWLLDLAEKCPTYQFLVAGGGDEADPYVGQIIRRAGGIPNVQLLGRIPDAALWKAYDRADLLLDTAAIAGVPTTFLEAWARGVPVVSTINPDGIVTSNNLGRVVVDVAGMAQAIAEFTSHPGLWLECSHAARRYFVTHHTVEAVGEAYRRLLLRIEGDIREDTQNIAIKAPCDISL